MASEDRTENPRVHQLHRDGSTSSAKLELAFAKLTWSLAIFTIFSHTCSECRLKSARSSFSPWIKTTTVRLSVRLFGKDHQCEDRRSPGRFTLFGRAPGNSTRNPGFVHSSSSSNEDSTPSTYRAEDSPKNFHRVSRTSYFKAQSTWLSQSQL